MLAFDRMKKRFAEKKNKSIYQKLSTRDNAKKLLKDKSKGMFSKYCPLYNGYCTTNCVHFYEGTILPNITKDSTTYTVKFPRCKLWSIK